MPVVCTEEYEEDNTETLLLRACILLNNHVVKGEDDEGRVTNFLESVGFNQQVL